MLLLVCLYVCFKVHVRMSVCQCIYLYVYMYEGAYHTTGCLSHVLIKLGNLASQSNELNPR